MTIHSAAADGRLMAEMQAVARRRALALGPQAEPLDFAVWWINSGRPLAALAASIRAEAEASLQATGSTPERD